MPSIDIIDEMYVVEARDVVRERCCDEGQWAIWFPDLTLAASRGPGAEGCPVGRQRRAGRDRRGVARGVRRRHDRPPTSAREPAKRVGDSRRTQTWATRRYALPLKAHLLAAKFAVEAGRELGTPRVPLGERVVSAPNRSTDLGRARSNGDWRRADEGAARWQN